VPPHRNSAYRPDIDGLRAIAVISVVLYHLGIRGFEGGFVGVDVFFVISGFLITGYILADLEAGTFSFGRFYVRRARRLFPALFFTLATSFIVGMLLLSPDHFEALSNSLVTALASVSNVQFWRETGYFDAKAHLKPLLHTWSLGVEEQFYFVWPLTLTALWKFRRSRAVVVFLVISALVSLYFTEQWLRTDRAGAFYLAPFRVTEFAIGALCVWLVKRQPERTWISELLVTVGLLAIGYSVFAFDEKTAFPGLNALVPCLAAAAVIHGGRQATRVGALLTNRFAVGTGLISYSLYLAHWPIYVFYRYWKVGGLSTIERLAIVPVSFAAAVLMYYYVERPFRVTADRPGRLRPAAFAAVCVALAALLATPAALAWRSGGWEWRVSPEITSAVGDAAQFNAARRTAIRSPSCHMSQGFDKFQPALARCLRIEEGKANVLVMGDSHAADLWAALRRAYPEVNFLQATGANCAPIESRYDDALDACPRLIRHVKRSFAGLRTLDGVILSARWSNRFHALKAEVEFHDSIGVPIAIFGPVMEFEPDVRTLAYRFGKTDGLDDFINGHRVMNTVRLDREMRAYFAELDVPYVSKIDLYCRRGTCPLLDRNGQLLIQDYGHWGIEAMEYFGRQVALDFVSVQALFAGQQGVVRRSRRRGGDRPIVESVSTNETR
jgi:peptidoglycan/LPS O-acetylase OafA/YrhL